MKLTKLSGAGLKPTRSPFLVEILDWKTKQQLCFFEKVEPHATISDIRLMFHKLYPQWYPSRQSIRLDPKGKSLRDGEILQLLLVGMTATLYFKDLGPQVGWTMVFLIEYTGPLFIYFVFYFRMPFIYGLDDRFTSSQHPVVKIVSITGDLLPGLLIISITLFTHHPTCEAGNFSIHVALSNLRRDGKIGSKTNKIPYPTKNPFTWLFYFVSCPNYTYELGTWIGFTIMTQCVPVGLFTLLCFIQMTIWAKDKHCTYIREFKDYPSLRMSIIPFLL
ncbi:very-long-chain enoyl-CoA reductase-like isoform X10 [Rhineura floridana]|uniref:very-long-chain enoyl-CoA reductase-like isoform X10 n=1 Tax=Rhineura floridana TaxID=261503 RepID=UPI002AC8193A|nr:very-long-chain enoyl-CoA reductase-like isoform X10 [Rhineura floridana]